MKQRIVIGLIGILIVYMVYGCFIIGVFADGWISPTGHDDIDGYWGEESYAYDDNVGTYAVEGMYGAYDGGYLELILSASVTCSKIRFYVGTLTSSYVNFMIVQVYKIGVGWSTVQDGSFSKGSWVEKSFSEATVSKARVLFYSTYPEAPYPVAGYLCEFDFWEVEVSDAVPTYSNVGDNGVTQVGEYVTVSCFWEDDFSLNTCYVEHNSTGIYTNYSISVSGSSSWANKTFQLAFTSGYKVAYRFFCSDNASQWNVTSYYYITLTPLYITFYLNNSTQGRFYVDLVNTVNNTQNGYDYNETVFLLGATYNENYTWSNFTYSETEIVTNFYNYTTDGNKTIWCYFDICNVTVSSGDGNYTETDLHEYFALGVLISCVCVTMFLIILIDKKDLVRGK